MDRDKKYKSIKSACDSSPPVTGKAGITINWATSLSAIPEKSCGSFTELCRQKSGLPWNLALISCF